MNVFRQNEEQRTQRDAQDAAGRTETVKRRSLAAARLEAELNDFLRGDFPTVLVSRADDILTITRTDGMTLIITVLDKLYNLDYPGATDGMAKHRKNFGCYVMEKQMTAKVVDWLNGKP